MNSIFLKELLSFVIFSQSCIRISVAHVRGGFGSVNICVVISITSSSIFISAFHYFKNVIRIALEWKEIDYDYKAVHLLKQGGQQVFQIY